MRPKPPTPPTAPPRSRIVLSALVLIAATVLAYANSLRGPFLFDDKPAILENPTIRDLGQIREIFSPPPIGSSVTGRPVVNASLAVNYAVSRENPWSYHAVNLAIHGLAGLLLFGLVRRTLQLPSIPARLQAGGTGLALTVAAVWLLHPLQTESVSSIIQRTESLVGLFYLLTLYLFVRGVSSGRPAGWHLGSMAACLVGMATKEVMVTAPLLVLAYDRIFVSGGFLAALRARRAYYLGLAATWILLAVLVLGGGGSRGEAAGFGLGVTPWTYALTQCAALVRYLRLSFWPHPLVLDYGTNVATSLTSVLPQALIVLALLAAAVWAWRARPFAGFCAVAFFLLLAPSSSVVPLVSQTMAEHRMYLPLAPLVALVFGAAYLAVGRVTWVIGAGVAVLFGALTWQRNLIYQSELAAWSDTVARAPANARAQINLAECLILLGRPADALAPAEAAVALRPNYAEARTNLGIVLTQLGRPAEALPHCVEAVRLQPDRARNHSNLGAALLQLGRNDEAIRALETALRLARESREIGSIRGNLGAALLRTGRIPEAIAQFQEVVRLTPDVPDAHYRLGLALGLGERYDEAMAEFATVLRLQPGHAAAREALQALSKP